METMYNIILGLLPKSTVYWTLKGRLEQRISTTGRVFTTWVPVCGKKIHRNYMPEFHSLADICDFYSVEIETAEHMAYRNGWKIN